MLFESPDEHIYLYIDIDQMQHFYERTCLRTKTRRNIKQKNSKDISTSELAEHRGVMWRDSRTCKWRVNCCICIALQGLLPKLLCSIFLIYTQLQRKICHFTLNFFSGKHNCLFLNIT